MECRDHYSMFDQEERNFTRGWKLDNDSMTEEELERVDTAYRFHSMLELRGLPYWGVFSTYSGAGYVADLGTTRGKANSMLTQLKANDWVDVYTRAVILEYTTYNPNVNLFTYVLYVMEFPATGGVIPFPRVNSFQVKN